MNQELQNYINEEKNIGTDDEAIKQKLRDSGWEDKMFNEYFIPPTNQQEPHAENGGEWTYSLNTDARCK